MKIIIAPDSFKGSLSAIEVCREVKNAALDIFSSAEIICMPMADGGDGTIDCLIGTLRGKIERCIVSDPLGREIRAKYGIFERDKAIIEMAEASGLSLVAKEEQNIMSANTFGTGQLIFDAVLKGVKTIYLGLGGCATNDGGLGAMSALGVKFLDSDGNEVAPKPCNFEKIDDIDVSGIDERVLGIKFVIITDVKNTLLGENGATYMFSKQKGATEELRPILERGLTHYVDILEKKVDKKLKKIQGGGAGGGLAVGLLSVLDAEIKSGAETVIDILHLEEVIKDADLVITGEGRMDYGSGFGKVACGVGELCKKADIPCIALVGGMGENAEVMYNHGICSIVTAVNGIMSEEFAMRNAKKLCRNAASRIFALIKAGEKIFK